MIYTLLTISYLLDIILFILLIILIIGVFQLLGTVRKEYGLIEKLKIAPGLIAKNPRNSFEQLAAKNKDGTYLISFYKHKSLNIFIRRLIVGALGFLGLKLIIVSLIFLQVPRLGEAQPKFYSALYQTNNYESFSKGTFTLTQWDNDGINLQAGQLDGNYISTPIGNGISTNQWKNLSYKTEVVYGLAPTIQNLISLWSFDSLTKCTESKYSCKPELVNLTEGVYNTKAYRFDGFKSRVKIDQNVSPSGSFTIAAWIKPDQATLNGSEDQNYTIFAKAYGDYTAKPPYALKYQLFFGIKNGSLSLIYWPDANQDHWVMVQNSKYNFAANHWYHVAGVYDDKNKTLKLYIDGIEQFDIMADYDDKSKNSINSKIHYYPNFKENLPSWIGGLAYKWMDGEEKPINVFKGSIDHVALANSALSILDIRNLITASGTVSFQVRTGDSLPLSGPFVGPKGDPTNYFYNPKANDLTFLAPSKYLQFICLIKRPNTNFNPKLNNVFVDYLTTEESNLKIATTNAVDAKQNPTRDLAKEREAIGLFYKFFKALPQNSNDWQFVNILAYGRIEKRDLTLEQKALTAFVKHYKRLPSSDLDWRIIKALAYCSKGTTLMKSWLGIK
jgi:hypothetical protein